MMADELKPCPFCASTDIDAEAWASTDNKAGGLWYRRWLKLTAENARLREALNKAREYVVDHQEAQPNDETFGDLAKIDTALSSAHPRSDA